MSTREPWAWMQGEMTEGQARYELESPDSLGCCGCGMPEAAAAFVLRVLDCYSHPSYDGDPRIGDHDMLKACMPDDGVRYFMLYQLDRADLTEHGGGVPGWLTPKGKALREALRRHGPEVIMRGILNLNDGEILE